MYGRVADPLRLYSHHPTVLFGTSIYELAQQRANHLEPRLKTLVQLQVARMVGCPW